MRNCVQSSQSEATFAVVIPTIGQPFLDTALQSVTSQSERPTEVVVFDNSTSHKLRCQSAFGTHPDIRWVCAIGEAMLPAVDSWNQAVASTNCTFVSILGDDDILLPEFCAAAWEEIRQRHDFCIMAFEEIDQCGRLMPFYECWPLKTPLPDLAVRRLRMQNRLPLRLGGCLFKRRDFERIGGFKTGISGSLFVDDYFLFEMSALTGHVWIVHRILWQYRRVPYWQGNKGASFRYPSEIKSYLKRLVCSLESLNVPSQAMFPLTSGLSGYREKLLQIGVEFWLQTQPASLFGGARLLLAYAASDASLKLKIKIARRILLHSLTKKKTENEKEQPMGAAATD